MGNPAYLPAAAAGVAITYGPWSSHLLAESHDIRTVQELLGHQDVSTTMIYTHVLNRGPAGVPSTADRMFLS